MNNEYVQLISLLSRKNIMTDTEEIIFLLLCIDKESILECDYKSIEDYLSTILVFNTRIKEGTRDKLVSILEYLRDTINEN